MTVAVVVIAHGSRAESANDAHRDAVAALDQSVAHAVTPAFLELAEPDIPAAIAAALAAGADEVLVLPFFLYPGRHIVEDIPNLVTAAAAAHPAARIRLLPAFGDDPGVRGLLASQINAALED